MWENKNLWENKILWENNKICEKIKLWENIVEGHWNPYTFVLWNNLKWWVILVKGRWIRSRWISSGLVGSAHETQKPPKNYLSAVRIFLSHSRPMQKRAQHETGADSTRPDSTTPRKANWFNDPSRTVLYGFLCPRTISHRY